MPCSFRIRCLLIIVSEIIFYVVIKCGSDNFPECIISMKENYLFYVNSFQNRHTSIMPQKYVDVYSKVVSITEHAICVITPQTL